MGQRAESIAFRDDHFNKDRFYLRDDRYQLIGLLQ